MSLTKSKSRTMTVSDGTTVYDVRNQWTLFQATQALTLRQRTTASNVINLTADIKYGGPNGNALFGQPSWRDRFEEAIYAALNSAINSLQGTVSPEGYPVSREQFSVNVSVTQRRMAPSIKRPMTSK